MLLRRVQYTFLGRRFIAALFVCVLPCYPNFLPALLPCFVIFLRLFGLGRGAIAAINEAVLRGFLVIQDRAAGFADGYAGLDLFGADRAIVKRLGVVEPRFVQAQEARGAALQIGNEHGILGAFPLEISGVDEATMETFEAAARIVQLRSGWRVARGHEYAVKAAFAGIAV